MKKYFLLASLLMYALWGCTQSEKPLAVFSSSSAPTLSIRYLGSLDLQYEKLLSQSVDTKTVYIIVHPSYYVFFHKKPFQILSDEKQDAVESFINGENVLQSPTVYLLKEYERREMEFIASARANNKIIILLLPGNYRTAKDYLYKSSSSDEYARYLNGAARDSYTIFYVESKNSGTGRLERDELNLLLSFIERMAVKNIYIGGGYIGRCQEQFYDALSQSLPADMLAIAPELSSISPEDITDSTSKMLLTPDMQLNTWAFNYFVKNGGIKNLRTKVNIKNLGEERTQDKKENNPEPFSNP